MIGCLMGQFFCQADGKSQAGGSGENRQYCRFGACPFGSDEQRRRFSRIRGLFALYHQKIRRTEKDGSPSAGKTFPHGSGKYRGITPNIPFQ